MKTVSIIGCGKVGKTLGRLWTERRVLGVRAVLNRSSASTMEAVEFIRSGYAVTGYAELPRTDMILIAASDDAIEVCCQRLCGSSALGPGVIVFHCSGSLPSTILEPAQARGALIASIHPVKSFADPARAVEAFRGTFCAVEGDPEACRELREVMARCGAVPFTIRPDQKLVYHAATVFVCNYLVALLEIGLRCFDQSGVKRDQAMRIMEPIVRETVENALRLGPVDALTGPIARGDQSVISRQHKALAAWNPEIAAAYRSLGRVALDLAAAQARAMPEALAAIQSLLKESP